MFMETFPEVIFKLIYKDSVVVRHNVLALKKMKDDHFVCNIAFFETLFYGCSSSTFCMQCGKISNMLNLLTLTLCPCINHCSNGIRSPSRWSWT